MQFYCFPTLFPPQYFRDFTSVSSLDNTSETEICQIGMHAVIFKGHNLTSDVTLWESLRIIMKDILLLVE